MVVVSKVVVVPPPAAIVAAAIVTLEVSQVVASLTEPETKSERARHKKNRSLVILAFASHQGHLGSRVVHLVVLSDVLPDLRGIHGS